MIQEIESIGIGIWEEAGEGSLGHEGQVADIFLSSRGSNTRESLFVGRAEDVEDLVELIDVISAFEKWSPAKQFCENTAYRPNID